MNRPLELVDAASGMGARGCRGNGGDEEHAVERAEQLPRHRLVRREARRGRNRGGRLLGADEAALKGDPRVTARGRRLAEAAREGAAATGVAGRRRRHRHAGWWWVRRRGRLAGGDHGDGNAEGLEIENWNWGFWSV
jgi:hypothetical protein